MSTLLNIVEHGTFELYVEKPYFKFNAAHFIVHEDRRERLHGHGYRAAVRLRGKLQEDGYVVDFGVVKKAMRALCERLDERFLVPAQSPHMEISTIGRQMTMVLRNGDTFSMPLNDCLLLPLRHTSAEEIARWMCKELLFFLGVHALQRGGVSMVEVTVAESEKQEARFAVSVPPVAPELEAEAATE